MKYTQISSNTEQGIQLNWKKVGWDDLWKIRVFNKYIHGSRGVGNATRLTFEQHCN